MAGLSVEELSKTTGLSIKTIENVEAFTNGDGDAVERIRLALEARGILFLAAGEDNPGAGPGVRLRHRDADHGIRPQNLSSANDG